MHRGSVRHQGVGFAPERSLAVAALAPVLSQRTALALALKRLVDVLIAFILLVLAWPLILIAAVLIAATSRGPVFFVQKRAGRWGNPFRCVKFRTMVQGAEAMKVKLLSRNEISGLAFKIRDDPRITPVGRLLRKTSIDELPQLFNVLRGEMSLVGPRPPSLDEVAGYGEREMMRLAVTPGISGLWQVSGRSAIKDFNQWIALDLEYIENWSLALDLKILILTVPAVLSMRGAE